MEDVDFRTPRGLDRSVIMSPAQAGWVSAKHNLLITGPTGAGKSFVATALAHAAIRRGHTALYIRTRRLLTVLVVAPKGTCKLGCAVTSRRTLSGTWARTAMLGVRAWSSPLVVTITSRTVSLPCTCADGPPPALIAEKLDQNRISVLNGTTIEPEVATPVRPRVPCSGSATVSGPLAQASPRPP